MLSKPFYIAGDNWHRTACSSLITQSRQKKERLIAAEYPWWVCMLHQWHNKTNLGRTVNRMLAFSLDELMDINPKTSLLGFFKTGWVNTMTVDHSYICWFKLNSLSSRTHKEDVTATMRISQCGRFANWTYFTWTISCIFEFKSDSHHHVYDRLSNTNSKHLVCLLFLQAAVYNFEDFCGDVLYDSIVTSKGTNN